MTISKSHALAIYQINWPLDIHLRLVFEHVSLLYPVVKHWGLLESKRRKMRWNRKRYIFSFKKSQELLADWAGNSTQTIATGLSSAGLRHEDQRFNVDPRDSSHTMCCRMHKMRIQRASDHGRPAWGPSPKRSPIQNSRPSYIGA